MVPLFMLSLQWVYNNNNNIAFNSKEDSLQLNSDNDNGYNSLDNQFIQALTWLQYHHQDMTKLL